jgi:hypothetical protein
VTVVLHEVSLARLQGERTQSEAMNVGACRGLGLLWRQDKRAGHISRPWPLSSQAQFSFEKAAQVDAYREKG